MKKNFLKCLLLSCSVMVLLNACVKDKYTGNQTGDSGPSYVRITEAKVYSQFFAPFASIKPVTILSVRRDAASSGALASTNAVALTDITSTYLSVFNTKNGSSYSSMPTTLYTFSTTDATIAKTSTGYTFNFGPGDFAKNLVFNIDGSQVDLSKQYAIAFTISNTGGLTKKAGLDTIVATVAIKNKYDGVYTTSGTMVDITNATLTEFNNYLSAASNTTGIKPPQQIELRTTSANTCDVYDNYYYGGYYYPINSNGAASQYGNFCPSLTFDLSTDKVSAVVNHYGQPQAAVGRAGRLDPTGTVNAYESGKITIKFNMTQPQAWNGNPASCAACSATAPYVRTTWDQVWKYIGSR